MTIELSWYREGHIAYAKLSGNINSNDLKTGNQTISMWLDEATVQQFHVIFDATAMQRITFSPLEQIHILNYLKHERMSGFVVFGGPSYLKHIINFMGSIISQMTRAKFHATNTLDEGLLYLEKLDPSLTSSPSSDGET